MSYINANGVWRNNNPMICHNGVWRKSNEFVNVNGVWRSNNKLSIITANQISKFEMLYVRTKDIRYPRYDDLRDNHNMPITASITSEVSTDEFNLDTKSFVIEYTNDEPSVEGLQVYVGTLNAILDDGSILPVSSMSIAEDSGVLQIDVDGYTLCEPYGPPPIGWNRLFSKEDNLPRKWDADKKIISLNSYSILPAYSRSDMYSLTTVIGIARNMSDRYINMVGSHGLIEHCISQVKLNGNTMPFKITVYE